MPPGDREPGDPRHRDDRRRAAARCDDRVSVDGDPPGMQGADLAHGLQPLPHRYPALPRFLPPGPPQSRRDGHQTRQARRHQRSLPRDEGWRSRPHRADLRLSERRMHAIRIDRSKPLAAEPHVGHNRYHPDIAPVAEIGEGEEIALETRDALDGQIKPGMSGADLAGIEAGVVHPLTGPVFVKGAQPGDMLEIEFTDIIAQPTAFSAIMPGLGFLRDVFADPFLVHWQIRDGWATSAEIPGVRIPGAPFMGVSAVAPSAAKLAEWTAREQR